MFNQSINKEIMCNVDDGEYDYLDHVGGDDY